MPFQNQHAARVKSPSLFVEDSFRTKKVADGVSIIIGKLKSDPKGSTVTQAYRFDVSKFSAKEARKWLKDHDVKVMKFEAAKPKNKESKTKAHIIAQLVKHWDQTPTE
jgi:hypothetical protein